jgi:hypothetical protein
MMVEGNVLPLENGPHLDGELLAAVGAVVPARTDRVPAQRLHGVGLAAQRADAPWGGRIASR